MDLNNESEGFEDFEIAWTIVENILDKERARSIEFIVNNLS